MNKDNLEKFRSLIEVRIDEINKKLGVDDIETKPIAPDVAIGRLSRMDSMQMQQMALDSIRRQKSELQNLRNALTRIDKGTYGNCGLCRKPIAEARLEAQLDAVLCINCAR